MLSNMIQVIIYFYHYFKINNLNCKSNFQLLNRVFSSHISIFIFKEFHRISGFILNQYF